MIRFAIKRRKCSVLAAFDEWQQVLEEKRIERAREHAHSQEIQRLEVQFESELNTQHEQAEEDARQHKKAAAEELRKANNEINALQKHLVFTASKLESAMSTNSRSSGIAAIREWSQWAAYKKQTRVCVARYTVRQRLRLRGYWLMSGRPK